VVVGPVPVIAMLYPTVVVWVVVVIVAVAVAGGSTDAGLTVQAGGEVVIWFEVTWQLRFTVPLKPPTAPTLILVDDVPPGATACGSSEVVLRVNSEVPWATAAGTKRRHTARRHNAGTPASESFTLNAGSWDFTMRRFQYK
jgi:hypothetical protein